MYDRAELRKDLRRLGWSQRELAHRLEISEDAITMWFRPGRQIPGYAQAYVRDWLAFQVVAERFVEMLKPRRER